MRGLFCVLVVELRFLFWFVVTLVSLGVIANGPPTGTAASLNDAKAGEEEEEREELADGAMLVSGTTAALRVMDSDIRAADDELDEAAEDWRRKLEV